jgi:hypothetical protein
MYFLGTTSIYVHTKQLHTAVSVGTGTALPRRERLSPGGHLADRHPISVQMDNLISYSTILLLTTYIAEYERWIKAYTADHW